MAVYYMMVAIPFFYWLLVNMANLNAAEKRKEQVIAVFFWCCIILLGCRAKSVGVDLQRYIPQFKEIGWMTWQNFWAYMLISRHEPGYLMVVRLISLVSDHEQWFLTVMAVLTVVPIMQLYRKEADYDLLCIALFLVTPLFPLLFSGLRQALAISVTAISYRYVKGKQPVRFLLCICFAALFHRSALIALGIYPVFHARITKKWLWAVVPAMVMVFVFSQPIFNFLLRFVGEKYQERYASWGRTGAYMTLVLYVLFSILAFFLIDDDEADREMIGLRNLLLAATCLQCFASVHPLAMRMNYFFILFIPITLTKVIRNSIWEYRQIAWLAHFVMVVFFFTYFFLSAEGNNTLRIFPYRFFFQFGGVGPML